MADDLKAANAAARDRLVQTPHAVAAGYSAPYQRLLIELSDGVGLLLDPVQLQGLESATPADLDAVQISPSGFGLHFPTLDADLYVPGLLEGRFGSERFMAAMGARGGQAKSNAKSEAARRNGRLGGRPRKTA